MTIKSAFPHTSQPIRITQDMCDQNGHMNVLYYSKIFGESIEDYYICLLYTSPSPRDRTRSRMPSSA